MITKNLHIGLTGFNQNYYTKYVETTTDFPGFIKRIVNYTGNLTQSTEKAKTFSEEQEKSGDWNTVIFSEDTPMKWSGKYMIEAFGLTFQIAKNKKIFWAEANEDFWENWKNNKEAVKDAGFWLKKTDEGQWLVFIKAEGESVPIVEEDK